MNHVNCRRKKNKPNRLFDMNQFDEWFELTYKPINCGGLPVPKIISFKEHIRVAGVITVSLRWQNVSDI